MRLPPWLVAGRDPRRRRRLRERMARDFERKAEAIRGRMPPRLGNRPVFILPAIAVLGVLVLLFAMRGSGPGVSESADQQWLVADRELQTLSLGLAGFRADTGRFPTAGEGLPALLADPGIGGWQGPYVSHLRPDPWGVPYQYLPGNGDKPRLRSFGADRVPDTGQDVWADPLDLDQPPSPPPGYGVRIFRPDLPRDGRLDGTWPEPPSASDE